MKLALILLSSIVLLSGCNVIVPEPEPEIGHYYLSGPEAVASLGKVVVLEFDNMSDHADLPVSITENICQSLRKRHLFGVTPLYKEDSLWYDLELDKGFSSDYEYLLRAKRILNANAVITGRITEYSSYPRLCIGLHLKMTDLRTGEVVWGIEQIWDTTDMKVERRISKYYDESMRGGYEPMGYHFIMTSPRAFLKYVSDETTETVSYGSETYAKQRQAELESKGVVVDTGVPQVLTQKVRIIPKVTKKALDNIANKD